MKSCEFQESEPKILVISNNPFSFTNNNGKTLASFFKSFKAANIAQLYFSPELPNVDNYQTFYQFTDFSIIKSVIKREKSGKTVYPLNEYKNTEKKNDSFFSVIPKMIVKSNIARIIRELIWKLGNWKNLEFIEWVEAFSPDIIFFCAGDAGFAYRITKFLRFRFNSKLIIYVTDDYILPRKTKNIFWWIRRNYVKKKLINILDISHLFITISDKMSNEYSNYFGIKSVVLSNMTGSLKQTKKKTNLENINLVYAGGLHLNRHKTLLKLANAIIKYNISVDKNYKKVFLKVFSNNLPSKRVIRKLNILNASKFCGSLNSHELIEELNNCDVLVHVESFDKKSIESTLLSLSTKISEYLSLEKPILAIGPEIVASMKYLEDTAFCINKATDIFLKIQDFFKNQDLSEILSERSRELYQKNHNLDKNTELFRYEIMKLHN
jgi:glycosyltransferase involved in cell wall biosynthesis